MPNNNIKALLEKLDKEKLINFLAEYAKSDAKFANAVNVNFRKPQFEKELNKIEKQINIAIEGSSDYYYRNSWGYIDVDISDILAEIKQRNAQGHIRLAFAQAELLYRKLLKIFEYQAECEIADEVEICLDVMSEIVANAKTQEDKNYIFDCCISLAGVDDGKDYGADYEDRLLKFAAKFVNSDNVSQLNEIIERFNTGWRADEFKLIRLEIIRKLEGKKAAEKFIEENVSSPKIREIAYDNAMKLKDYAKAEKLCVDAISLYERHYGVSEWLYRLYAVYESSNDILKMTETAQTILLCGNIKYYDKLKSLLKKQSLWEKEYPKLLKKCETKLHYSTYMDILSKEKEYTLLLEHLQKHPDKIYKHGKSLVKNYRNEICEIYLAQISKEVAAASDRKAYRSVCNNISMFMKSGYKTEAAKLIEELRVSQKRRRAFIDELSRF